MRNLARLLLAALGIVAVATVAYGQRTPSPRVFPSQQVHYERHIINITSTGFSVDQGQLGQACAWVAATCSVKFAAVPYNAFILRGNWFQSAVCNAVTTCTMSIGTASGGAQLVSGQDIKTVPPTSAPAMTIVTTGQGAQATGNGIAQTGANGGFDLWVSVASTGGLPSAGSIVFTLEYLAPNDGNCVPAVPIGNGITSPAC